MYFRVNANPNPNRLSRSGVYSGLVHRVFWDVAFVLVMYRNTDISDNWKRTCRWQHYGSFCAAARLQCRQSVSI